MLGLPGVSSFVFVTVLLGHVLVVNFVTFGYFVFSYNSYI